jgi:hypothetical protein
LPKLLNSSMSSKEVSAQGLYSDIRKTNRFFLACFFLARGFSIITTYKHNNRLKGFRNIAKQVLDILSSGSCKAKTYTSCLNLSKELWRARAVTPVLRLKSQFQNSCFRI